MALSLTGAGGGVGPPGPRRSVPVERPGGWQASRLRWPSQPPQFRPPVPAIQDMLAPLHGREWLTYLSVIIPMGLFNLIGSLQNIESAEAAGD